MLLPQARSFRRSLGILGAIYLALCRHSLVPGVQAIHKQNTHQTTGSTITDPCAYVSRFTLVNAVTHKDIGDLPSTIHLKQRYNATAAFNIRVNVNDRACLPPSRGPIKSVLIKYKYDGKLERVFCENWLPYTVFGDLNPDGPDVTDFSKARYFRYTFPNNKNASSSSTTTTSSATATIRATPYFQNNCKGQVHGKSKAQSFDVIIMRGAGGNNTNHTAGGGGDDKNKKPFESTQELYNAVDRWLDGENTAQTDLATTYGFPIGAWDVSQISDFSMLFNADTCIWTCLDRINKKAARFNDDISMWNVSSATNMVAMFAFAESYGNWNLSHWDVSHVTNMANMFLGSNFNGDISAWDVSSVTDMSNMFFRNIKFNGNLTAWDVSSVTDMSYMFFDAYAFNGNITGWKVGNVTTMAGMFDGAIKFNQNIVDWDMYKVHDASYMFYNAESFNQDLCVWGYKFNYDAILYGMFENSGCPVTVNPMLRQYPGGPAGPFCHACPF